MIWPGAWNLCSPGIGIAPIREQARSHRITEILWERACSGRRSDEAFKGRKVAVY
jgi:hypothetical protein